MKKAEGSSGETLGDVWITVTLCWFLDTYSLAMLCGDPSDPHYS